VRSLRLYDTGMSPDEAVSQAPSGFRDPRLPDNPPRAQRAEHLSARNPPGGACQRSGAVDTPGDAGEASSLNFALCGKRKRTQPR
jgi:hypothetical protein